MIIGITGTLGAGKGTIVQYLTQKKGFEHFSVRGYLEESLGEGANRDSLVQKANELRAQHGPGYIAEQLLLRAIDSNKNAIIESLRTVGEINSLRKIGNFYLFGIDADIDKRYKRIVERGSGTDRISFEEFKANEEREMHSDDPNKQNLAACIELANFKFYNNGTIDDLFLDTEKILKEIKKPEDPAFRPSLDEYFMKLAVAASERSTCLRHHVGAILVRDKRVISTGYNGAVRGVKNCLELGCLRDELKIPSGTRHEICRAAHAEQNAIVQAAFNGIKTEGSTIYCTHTPCTICTKIMVNAGIKEIVNYIDYPDEYSKEVLKEAKVKLRKILRPDSIIVSKD